MIGNTVVEIVSCFHGLATNRKYRIARNFLVDEGDFYTVEAIWVGGWSDIGVETNTIAEARALAEQYDLTRFLNKERYENK